MSSSSTWSAAVSRTLIAVLAAKEGKKRKIVWGLLGTMLFGAIFLGVKVVEYSEKWEHHLVPGTHFAWHPEDPADLAGVHGRGCSARRDGRRHETPQCFGVSLIKTRGCFAS